MGITGAKLFQLEVKPVRRVSADAKIMYIYQEGKKHTIVLINILKLFRLFKWWVQTFQNINSQGFKINLV